MKNNTKNIWTSLSIEFANQRNYLDELFSVYPSIPEAIRKLDKNKWDNVENAFNSNDNEELIKSLLKLDLFPIKDSYIAYLRRDKKSIERNPKTVSRIGSALYSMGLQKIYEKSTEPKEVNRQMGQMFRAWMKKGELGIELTDDVEFFKNSKKDLILDLGDDGLKKFAKENLNYNSNKGLDLVARVNNKYVIGEAKFLTDFGGHQNAQFNDAITLVKNKDVNAITIAILDGVPYTESRNKMSLFIRQNEDLNIMSSLVLKEFLYQI